MIVYSVSLTVSETQKPSGLFSVFIIERAWSSVANPAKSG